MIAALGDLWLVDQRGRYRRLTDDAFVETDPAVGPDGRFVVFASDRGGQMDLWHAALPSGVLTQLTFTAAKAFAPALSPDGREVELKGRAYDALLYLLEQGLHVYEGDGSVRFDNDEADALQAMIRALEQVPDDPGYAAIGRVRQQGEY